MASWYLLSLTALLLLGCQRFLYKVAAERGCSSALTTTIFMATVTLFSAVAWFGNALPAAAVNSPLIVLALINSSSFAAATICNIEALKRLPATVTFPLTRLTLVLVVLFSIGFLGERLTAGQWLGMLCALAMVAILNGEILRNKDRLTRHRHGLLFVAANICCAAISSISCKFAAVSSDKAAFMTLTYALATLFSLLLNKYRGRTENGSTSKGATILLGVAMGVLNYFGFLALLSAMESGPLSGVALVTSMQFVIAISLAMIIYREKLSRQRLAAIALALAAVILMKH